MPSISWPIQNKVSGIFVDFFLHISLFGRFFFRLSDLLIVVYYGSDFVCLYIYSVCVSVCFIFFSSGLFAFWFAHLFSKKKKRVCGVR